MEKLLKDVLSDLGCSEKEAKFFIINYKLGPATINQIAKAARIERSTAYLIVDKLIEKGLLLNDFKKYKKLLYPVEPKTLLRMLSAKQRQVGRHEISLQESLPDLQAMFASSEIRPHVRTYEGNSGMLAVWKDILSISQEVLLWTNQQTENKFFTKEYHDLFIKERLLKKIPMRVLAVNNTKGKSLIAEDHASLRETQLLPKQTFFSAETYIYGNKIAILDYNKDIIGVIIESEQISQAQKAIFEMNWSNLKS